MTNFQVSGVFVSSGYDEPLICPRCRRWEGLEAMQSLQGPARNLPHFGRL